jgi:gluconate kinase
MPEELLDSQFEALEEPARAITADIDQTPEEIVSSIGRKIDNQE